MGAPFREKPPRLSRKGALRAGSSINAPFETTGGGGGGGLLSKGCARPRSLPAPVPHPFNISRLYLRLAQQIKKDKSIQQAYLLLERHKM